MKSPAHYVRFAPLLAALVTPTSLGQAGGHRMHPPMPDQRLTLQCRLEVDGESRLIETPLDLPSASSAARLEQSIELPAPRMPIRVLQYLPRARSQQDVLPDAGPQAKPALLLSIDGPKQSYQRWLIAGDAEHNRLVSFIGTWRFMAPKSPSERDELLAQFENELTREPMLAISRVDGSGGTRLAAKPGETHRLERPPCTVSVKKFFPHFAYDDETNQPTNESDRLENPAVLLAIEHNGDRRERWLFAKFPDFGEDEFSDLPYRMTLDCPLQKKGSTPDYALITQGQSRHEVWTRHEGKTITRPVKVGQRVPIRGSRYTFQLLETVPAGRLVENYTNTNGKGGVPALQIEWVDPAGVSSSIWLEMGRPRVVGSVDGRLTLAFGPQQGKAPGAHP